MNDRFKFRVWDNVEEEYVEDLDIIRLTQYGKFIFNNAENNTEPELNPKRFIFEQCTGLKDKNGELIFEGDIVRVYGKYQDIDLDEEIEVNYIDVVKSLEQFFSEAMVKGIYSALGCDTLSVEIIGNIYENPELLKKQQEDKERRLMTWEELCQKAKEIGYELCCEDDIYYLENKNIGLIFFEDGGIEYMYGGIISEGRTPEQMYQIMLALED